MLKHGANVNAVEKANHTPLDLASVIEDVDKKNAIIELLVNAGGEHVKDSEKQDPDN